MSNTKAITPTVVLPHARATVGEITRIYRAFGQRPVRVFRLLRTRVAAVAHRSRPSAVRATRRVTMRRTRRTASAPGREPDEADLARLGGRFSLPGGSP